MSDFAREKPQNGSVMAVGQQAVIQWRDLPRKKAVPSTESWHCVRQLGW